MWVGTVVVPPHPAPQRWLLSRSCLDFSVCLDRQRRRGLQRERSYSHFRCTHTSGILTLQAYSYALHKLGVRVAVSVTPGVVSSRLFSHALRWFIVLTCLAWTRCSRGIRHARRGLFTALLTSLAWVRCSHTLCVGSFIRKKKNCVLSVWTHYTLWTSQTQPA